MQNRVFFIISFLFLLITISHGREDSVKLYNRGAVLALNGKIDEAIPVFQKVIKISPYYCLGHYGLGKCYLYKYGMSKNAIKHLKLSVKYDRKFVKGYFHLGLANMLAKKYKHAIDSFKKTYEYDNTFLEALFNIAIVYDILGDEYNSARYLIKYFYEKTKDDDDIIF